MSVARPLKSKESKYRQESTEIMGKSISQVTRLIFLFLYLGIIIAISKLLFGTFFPSISETGLWFYSALGVILLNNLLLTPFYSTPADTISSSTASLIALLNFSPQASSFSEPGYTFWVICLCLTCLVLISSILSILTKDTENPTFRTLHPILFEFTNKLGKPNIIFSFVFLYALVAFHRTNSEETVTLSVAWLFILAQPFEKTLYPVFIAISNFSSKDSINSSFLGKIQAYKNPGLLWIAGRELSQINFGDMILLRTERDELSYAFGTDRMETPGGTILRAIKLQNKVHDNPLTLFPKGEAHFLKNTTLPEDIKKIQESLKKSLVGTVSINSTIDKLYFEIFENGRDLTQGSVVEIKFGNTKALYQIIEGITREENIKEKSTHGFIQANAKPIGAWEEKTEKISFLTWLPPLNSSVFLCQKAEKKINPSAIGHMPQIGLPVDINLHEAVTHNTAILGILGVGKTYLNLELIERLIKEDIKVICLDLTDEYEEILSKYLDVTQSQAEVEALNKIAEKGEKNYQQNKSSGGSIKEFSSKIKISIQEFINGASHLKIFNPSSFDIWKQDGLLDFKDKTAAMSLLSPVEITKIISEVTLEILQKMGKTENGKARCCLVYEEAHSLIPEWGSVVNKCDQNATNGTAKAILQGRKFGLGCIVVTQRTANVTKSILNQCNTVFAMRIYDPTGVGFLKGYIGEDYAQVLSTLKSRHAVFFGKGSNTPTPILIKLNERPDFLNSLREMSE